jgi:hypothetical protein
MRRITYLQGPVQDLVVLADVGMGAVALALPQDELTAAVRIGGILARNYGDRLPGEYRAVITGDDADEGADVDVDDGNAVVVHEDDPRVLLARDLLAKIGRGRDYTIEEFVAVRETLIE